MTDEADDEHTQNPQPDGGASVSDDTVRSTEAQASPSISPNSVEGLFLHALQMTSAEERERFLDDACDDKERRLRVTALLRAYEDAGSFLEEPASGPRPPDEVSLSFLKPINKEGVLGTIGPYEVLEVIGRGGMGVVLRAVDLKLNRIVAVKALLPELAANPNSRRRFLREAQAAAAISHPQVVTIHAVDDSHEDANGKPVPPYLVMECVVGQSLQQKLDRVGTLRLAEILRIGRQIGEGLAAAHKQGVIHRDIKPANILLENGVERVKITDFGLARAIDDITVTRTGEVSGTPQYMSPEQACGERVDHRSDLFSLGCVMYAMCTGHSPFRGDSIVHVIKRVTQDTPRLIADQNPEIPPWLIEIITCLLQKNPEQRFQSAEGVVAILDQHLSRIQHPTKSGSHSVINQQVPVADGPQPLPHPKTVEHPDEGVPMPSWLATPVLPSRFRISNVLLWIGIPILCCGVLGLIALAQGASWLQIAGFPPMEIQSFTFGALGVAVMFLLPALLLRVSEHKSPPKWWLPVVAVCCFGFLAYWGLTDPASPLFIGPTIHPTKSSATDSTMDNPVILKHPDWGEVRELKINRGGSTSSQMSPTETKLYLKPELSGTAIQIHVILMDGREWRTYFDVKKPETEIVIDEYELQLRDQSLVEVLDDAPDAKLRMIGYPSQNISVNAFSISKAPFHKALRPGEHKIILNYVLNEWDVPEGYVQFNKLEYRVTVPDTNPIQLSLKAILAEHGDQAKTHKLRWNPDFRPLPKDSDKPAGKTEASDAVSELPANGFHADINLASYKLGPGDLLGIHISHITSASAAPVPMKLTSRDSAGQVAVGMPVLVQDNGRIELPFECSIDVTDKSMLEIAAAITAFYEDTANILNDDSSGVVVTLLERRTPEITEILTKYRIHHGDTVCLWIDDLATKRKGEPHFPTLPPVTFPEERNMPPAIGTPYAVDENGDVLLPMVGNVRVFSLSLSEARGAIIKAYTDDQDIFRRESIGFLSVTVLQATVANE